MKYAVSCRGTTGLVDIAEDWESYFAARSRNHRRHIRVVTARGESEGKIELQLVTDVGVGGLEQMLRLGFRVEDRSWKGPAGTSVLRTPGAFEFFLQQAQLLAQSGHLLLAFLNLNGEPIAFEYGWLAKGVYHSLKVGYDAAFERLSPGQLLRAMMLEKFHANGEVRLVDYLGPLCDATSKWTTRSYAVNRLTLANGALGKALLWCYQRKNHRSSPEHADRETPTECRPTLEVASF